MPAATWEGQKFTLSDGTFAIIAEVDEDTDTTEARAEIEYLARKAWENHEQHEQLLAEGWVEQTLEYTARSLQLAGDSLPDALLLLEAFPEMRRMTWDEWAVVRHRGVWKGGE